jgi:riboflavin kinase / FMN adenylyltransferase
MAIFPYALADPMPAACQGGAITIGNFDGVHVGHQSLLQETARQARAANGPAIAVTFDPSPMRILHPDKAGPQLTTIADRAVLLQQYGADHVLILKTSLTLLQLNPREFFDGIIVEQLQAKSIIEGYNFFFGHDREGTVEVLRALCTERALPFTLMPPQAVLGQPVSSSRVRGELLAGHVEVVRQLLGRAYRIVGVVGVGQKRGATLGFPTANLHDVPTLLPGDGVYHVVAAFDGATWQGAANVGPNPTFGEHARKVEVHLIGFDDDLYGKTLSVEFVRKIRNTKKFGDGQELTTQIQSDIRNIINGTNV